MNEQFDSVQAVQLLARGDVKGFDMIYNRYAPRLYELGMKEFHSNLLTEKLIKTVFEELWFCRAGYTPETFMDEFTDLVLHHLKRMLMILVKYQEDEMTKRHLFINR